MSRDLEASDCNLFEVLSPDFKEALRKTTKTSIKVDCA